MSWGCINLDPMLTEHPKLMELEDTVGGEAIAYLVRLWCWTYKLCPDGDITKYANTDFLERRVMAWQGESGKLLQALTDLKWIEKKGRGGRKLVLHGWSERNSHVIALREKQASNARARVEKLKGGAQAPVAQRDTNQPKPVPQNGKSGLAQPPSLSIPSHTIPILSIPNLADPGGLAAPDREGAQARVMGLDGLIHLHKNLFGRIATLREEKIYSQALIDVGREPDRWLWAFKAAKGKGARTAKYVCTTAANADQEDFNPVRIGWTKEQIAAAQHAAKAVPS